MNIYTETKIDRLYLSNLRAAERKLAELPVFCGRKPDFGGLTGWVYEQTIQYCLKRELRALKVKAEITEQVSLRSRVKADFKVANVAIEVKNSGLFGPQQADKYAEYKKAAAAKGWAYLFITRTENYRPYRTGIVRSLGEENAFFMDAAGDWQRFVRRVVGFLSGELNGRK